MTYNLVKDYDWTSAPRGSGLRKNAPYIWLQSYKLKSNQIMQAIQGFINIGSGITNDDAESFYDKMYGEASSPEDVFFLPFFEDGVRSFNNTFGDTFQNGIGESGGIGAGLYEGAKQLAGSVGQTINTVNFKGVVGGIESAAEKLGAGDKGVMDSIMSAGKSLVGGPPGTYIESPMFYQFDKNDSPINVSFILSNTINEDSLEKNKKLIHKLTEINRPLRRNSIAVDPPRIYQVRVPGHRFIRWAFCNSFDVKLKGARRIIEDVVVPEAYEISMSFQSLTLEHAGFLKRV